MRLSTFIRENEDEILRDWEDFARKLGSAPDEMNREALRDHALGMLRFIADVLEKPQDDKYATDNTRRRAFDDHRKTPAEAHGGNRSEWGFDVGDMVAEFRALRRSVTRLWGEATETMGPDDLVRFNEAMDRELEESIESYSGRKERQAQLLETMLSHSSDQSCIFDRDGRILYANRAMALAYGKHPKEIVGELVESLDADFAEEVHRQIRHVIDNREEYRGDFTTTNAEGDVHVIEYIFAPVIDKDGHADAVVTNARDITERKMWERTLWKHANHDHLTGVPNRRLFFDRLDQDIRLAKRNEGLLGLLYIDLDKFKEANDRLGHDGGDELLKQVVERIGSCIRETDTLARMGGDEFTVILMGVGDKESVETIAQIIIEQLSRPFFIQHESVRITASIGIALYPEHGEAANDLTVRADQAMYSVKSAGAGRFQFFKPEDHLNAPSRHAPTGDRYGDRTH